MKTRAQNRKTSSRGGSTSRLRSNRGRTRGTSRARSGGQIQARARSARISRRTTGSRRGGTSERARSQRTQDHDEIREWVEARGGHPAIVKRTARSTGRGEEGVLRIDFPGFSGAGSLEEVSWEEWFRIFDDRNLAFLYQEKTADGKPSRFNKLVCP